MIVQVSLEARGDLMEADLHYSTISDSLADRLLEEFSKMVDYIGRHPKSGIPLRVNYRMFPLKKFPYLVICRMKKDYIEVIALIHQDKHPKHRTRRIK